MCIYLSYGLVLILPIAAVLVAARGRPATGAWVGLGFLLVVALVTSLGFNWWSGYQLVTERYSAGLGGVRNYGYWAWANLAAFALACGPAVVVGVRRLLAGARWAGTWSVIRDPRNTMSVIVGTTLVMVAVATLGGLSKGEVERIWLPFGGVLLLACVAIPASRARLWLIAQVVLVLCIQNLVMTPW